MNGGGGWPDEDELAHEVRGFWAVPMGPGPAIPYSAVATWLRLPRTRPSGSGLDAFGPMLELGRLVDGAFEVPPVVIDLAAAVAYEGWERLNALRVCIPIDGSRERFVGLVEQLSGTQRDGAKHRDPEASWRHLSAPGGYERVVTLPSSLGTLIVYSRIETAFGRRGYEDLAPTAHRVVVGDDGARGPIELSFASLPMTIAMLDVRQRLAAGAAQELAAGYARAARRMRGFPDLPEPDEVAAGMGADAAGANT